MSDIYYLKQWLATKTDLEKLIKVDQSLFDLEPIEERQEALKKISPMYYQYRRIVQCFTTCYDQIVQPQIREIMRKMLDYSIVRMLEYRQEIVNLTCIECPWPNDYLFDARLTPDDVELCAPLYDTASRLAKFEHRRRIVEDFKKMKANEEDRVSENSSTSNPQDFNEKKIFETDEKEVYNRMILLIQSHERARIARRIVKKVERQRAYDLKIASGYEPKDIDVKVQARAATIIQKVWRDYTVRRHMKCRSDRINELVGLTIPSWNPNKNLFERDEAARKDNLEQQSRAAQMLEKVVAYEKDRIWSSRGPQVVDDVKEEIRQWYFHWFQEIEYLDSIPPAEVGGSVLIATGQARTPTEYLAEQTSANDKKKGEAGKTEDKEEEFGEGEEKEEGWKMQESKAMAVLLEVSAEFKERWARFTDQLLDPDREALLLDDVIYEDLHYDLLLEMRSVADEEMRVEMARLNRAIATDLALDGMPFSPLRPQQFDAVQMPILDLDADLLKEDEEAELLLGLLDSGVLQMPGDLRPTCLNEWTGSVTVAPRPGPECRLGDLKEPIMDYCILPIGSRSVHELAPPIRSVCVCGPPGSGQAFIARAVCSELKAVVFNLTPERHVGRFLSRGKQNRLAQAVIRLAKYYAPSVVLVESESAWLKKLPAELKKVQPKRFVPIYKKIINSIKPGDQVLFLTTSSQPYLASQQFVKLHDKFVVIPVADCGSLYLAYRNGLMAYHGVDRRFPISSVTQTTCGLTTIELAREVVDKTVAIGRRMDFKRRPLKPEELLEHWLEADKPTKADFDSFDKFRRNLPLEIKRREIEKAEEDRALANKK